MADVLKCNTTLLRLFLRYNRSVINRPHAKILNVVLLFNRLAKAVTNLVVAKTEHSQSRIALQRMYQRPKPSLLRHQCGCCEDRVWVKWNPKNTVERLHHSFFDNLIKLNDLDVNAATRLLFELSSFIDDVHQMKIYYTYVACYRRMVLIEKEVSQYQAFLDFIQ